MATGALINQTLVNSGTATSAVYYTILASANGCVSPQNVQQVLVKPVPVGNANPAFSEICSVDATNVALNSSLDSTTYAWTVVANGVLGASAGSGAAISQTLTNPTQQTKQVIYTVTPTRNGCSGAPFTVVVNVKPKPVADFLYPTASCRQTEVIVTFNGQTRPNATYSWVVTPATILNSTLDSTQLSIAYNSTGNYNITLTVTDSGCVSTITKQISITPNTVNVNAVIDSVTNCDTHDNGAITLSATGGLTPYDYQWTGPNGFTSSDSDLVNLNPGLYTLRITDAIGCSRDINYVVKDIPAILIANTTSEAAHCQSNDGKIKVTTTGTSPITVDIYTTAGTLVTSATGASPLTISNIASGDYNVIVSDPSNLVCPDSVRVLVESIDGPLVTFVNQTSDDCVAGSNGSVTFSVAGTPTFTYTLIDGANTSQIGSIAVNNGSVTVSGLAAGNFSLVVTDANSCVTAENGTITSDPNSNLDITPTVTPATCGNANGAISLVVSGNVSTVSYVWTGPAGTSPAGANPTGLPAGQYTVTVKDGDCEKSANITILNSDGPSVTADVLTNNVCSTDKNGSAELLFLVIQLHILMIYQVLQMVQQVTMYHLRFLD
jgi:hypothetical protein